MLVEKLAQRYIQLLHDPATRPAQTDHTLFPLLVCIHVRGVSVEGTDFISQLLEVFRRGFCPEQDAKQGWVLQFKEFVDREKRNWADLIKKLGGIPK